MINDKGMCEMISFEWKEFKVSDILDESQT